MCELNEDRDKQFSVHESNEVKMNENNLIN